MWKVFFKEASYTIILKIDNSNSDIVEERKIVCHRSNLKTMLLYS